MNNKKHLALSISAIIFSGTANAAIDMTDGLNDDGATFASEIIIPAAPATTTLTNAASIFDVGAETGFGISKGADRFVRYDLSNGATFTTTPVVPIYAAAVVGESVTLSSGGAGETFVIYQVTAGSLGPDTAILITDVITLDIADIDIVGQGTVNITYSHFESAANAVANTSPLATASEDIISFVNSLTLTCAPVASPDLIDVAASSIFFDGGVSDVTTTIGTFTVGFTANLKADGSALADADDIIDGTATSVTVSGSNGWSAITGLADAAAGSTTYALVSGDFVDTTVNLSDFSGAGELFTATADGTNPIASSAITITVAPTANAGYTADTATGSCVLGEMTKNGSTDRLTFLLTPNGNFKNFVRVTNPSSVTGNVFLTVTDDAGAMANIPLSDVSVGGTALAADLAGGASTDLINVNDLSTAAVAANAALDVTGKLRLDVEAEFGTTGATSAVNVQAFSMSKDNNSFFMLNPE